jgi:RNA polymerase sigma-70 factor (sigma-E family)
VRALVAEDSDEFAAFVSATYRALVRYGFSLVADRSKAEDLVQSALVKTLAAWPRIDDHAHGVAYTKVVMARAAWRAGRRRWRSEAPTEVLPESPASASPFLEVDDADFVRRALAALPQDQRVVLVLRYLDDLSEAETASRLGCPSGTVKSRTFRALEALRRKHLLEERPATVEGGET